MFSPKKGDKGNALIRSRYRVAIPAQNKLPLMVGVLVVSLKSDSKLSKWVLIFLTQRPQIANPLSIQRAGYPNSGSYQMLHSSSTRVALSKGKSAGASKTTPFSRTPFHCRLASVSPTPQPSADHPHPGPRHRSRTLRWRPAGNQIGESSGSKLAKTKKNKKAKLGPTSHLQTLKKNTQRAGVERKLQGKGSPVWEERIWRQAQNPCHFRTCVRR